MQNNILSFVDQIKEDLSIIKKDWSGIDDNLVKSEFAFNYWVLSNLYSIDENIVPTLVTEYSDKNIDCYVHYDEDKELYLLQNKYYSQGTILNIKDVSDFLLTPLNTLLDDKYIRNKELQHIFNRAYKDNEYIINMHFYVSNKQSSEKVDEVNSLINKFNDQRTILQNNKANIRAKIFFIEDIYNLYYGESYNEKEHMQFDITTKNRGTFINILPQNYNLNGMREAYYIVTPVTDIYNMIKKAKDGHYSIFEENIREYLGRSGVNAGIIKTLRNKKDRQNFFYYNNGVTIICNKVTKSSYASPKGKTIILHDPQIINGCQTVNTIYEVINSSEFDKNDYEQIFVMVKIIIYSNSSQDDKDFYRNIVKYTNKQNAIAEKAFGAQQDIFKKIQEAFLDRGFFLMIKGSDKYKFSNLDLSSKKKMLDKSKRFFDEFSIDKYTQQDIAVPLEKLLQVYISFMKDGYVAYQKKSLLLKPTSDLYKDYSIKMQDNISFDNLVRLYVMYVKADKDRINSSDKKSTVPFYIINFYGMLLGKKSNAKEINSFIEYTYKNTDRLNLIYKYTSNIVKLYRLNRQKAGEEYNTMIKKPIDTAVLSAQIDAAEAVLPEEIISAILDVKNYTAKSED